MIDRDEVADDFLIDDPNRSALSSVEGVSEYGKYLPGGRFSVQKKSAWSRTPQDSPKDPSLASSEEAFAVVPGTTGIYTSEPELRESEEFGFNPELGLVGVLVLTIDDDESESNVYLAITGKTEEKVVHPRLISSLKRNGMSCGAEVGRRTWE